MPSVGTEVQLAACSKVESVVVGPVCAEVGNTETSAPLSTRKSRPLLRSERHNDLGDESCVVKKFMVCTAGRYWRPAAAFPELWPRCPEELRLPLGLV